MKRLVASHPDYKQINRLMNMLGMLLNPEAHFETRGMDRLSVSRLQTIDAIMAELDGLLGSASAFYRWIARDDHE